MRLQYKYAVEGKDFEGLGKEKESLEKKLKSGKVLRIKLGIDPTGPNIHIGRAITLRKLRKFQDLGHKAVLIIGDFTAQIGDASDKLSKRPMLSKKEIKNNLKNYKKQIGKIIDLRKAEFKFNSKWLSKLKFNEVAELAEVFSVQQMSSRRNFKERLDKGEEVSLREFLYPIMQGYDSVALNVDGEVGGNDQLFNMLSGRILLKQIKQKEKFVVTVKLLEDGTGKKMGKSEGNMISLLDSAIDMYGKIMSWPDGLIVPGFELCTDYSMEDLEVVKRELATGENPRNIKMRLAREVTKLCTSEKEATQAEEYFVTTFQKKEIPEVVPVLKIEPGSTLGDTLISHSIVSSKSELRRLCEGGALSHLESGKTVSFEDTKKVPEKGTYKIGKNRFCKII